jgi:hypothetical protein
MNWVRILKNYPQNPQGEPPWPNEQPQPPYPAEQEEAKPLYDQKQQLGIAHYLLDDIQQIAQLLRQLHDEDGSADWERLLFDIERIKQILEDALTGDGPKPSGGGI